MCQLLQACCSTPLVDILSLYVVQDWFSDVGICGGHAICCSAAYFFCKQLSLLLCSCFVKL